jgi:hypothetical protein
MIAVPPWFAIYVNVSAAFHLIIFMQAGSVVGKIAPSFLLASIMFSFVLQLHDMQADTNFRRIMQIMGLSNTPYWASWVVLQAGLAFLEAGLLWGLGFGLFSFNLVSIAN